MFNIFPFLLFTSYFLDKILLINVKVKRRCIRQRKLKNKNKKRNWIQWGITIPPRGLLCGGKSLTSLLPATGFSALYYKSLISAGIMLITCQDDPFRMKWNILYLSELLGIFRNVYLLPFLSFRISNFLIY